MKHFARESLEKRGIDDMAEIVFRFSELDEILAQMVLRFAGWRWREAGWNVYSGELSNVFMASEGWPY